MSTSATPAAAEIARALPPRHGSDAPISSSLTTMVEPLSDNGDKKAKRQRRNKVGR